ncbi:MAG: hypothetical protein IPM64_06895 [Phycisphaerales bacterium]|nr:hypothetical protein [Phycisphaerales bacterium]
MSGGAWRDDSLRESDARFPSGRWVGYWRQESHQGRMQLDITFGNGRLFGDGRDFVGDFTLSGSYCTQSGRCTIHKTYLGQHDVHYDGTASARGIAGSWEIHDADEPAMNSRGPFHIWPVGPGSGESLQEEVAQPLPVHEAPTARNDG